MDMKGKHCTDPNMLQGHVLEVKCAQLSRHDPILEGVVGLSKQWHCSFKKASLRRRLGIVLRFERSAICGGSSQWVYQNLDNSQCFQGPYGCAPPAGYELFGCWHRVVVFFFFFFGGGWHHQLVGSVTARWKYEL